MGNERVERVREEEQDQGKKEGGGGRQGSWPNIF